MIALRPRSAITLAIASALGLMLFIWPLLLRVPEGTENVSPPFVFLVLLPVVVLVVLIDISEGGIDAKALAMLGCSPRSTVRCAASGRGSRVSDWCFSC